MPRNAYAHSLLRRRREELDARLFPDVESHEAASLERAHLEANETAAAALARRPKPRAKSKGRRRG